jgi:hypothetical protein
MKMILVALTLLTPLPFLSAQEKLSREETMKYACLAGLDLDQLMGTPIATDADLKRAVALHDGDYGGMILPEAKLTADRIAGAKTDVVPVGQLWLLKLTPMRDGEAIPSEKLRLATVSNEGTQVQVPQCALGVKRNASGDLELLVFGKSKEPLLSVPLKTLDGKQAQPGIDVEAERESASGRLTLTLAGKYRAVLNVTELQL